MPPKQADSPYSKSQIQALNNRSLTVDDFKNDPRVIAAVNAVKQAPPIVSDVLDKNGNQYVDLVQKGGGVLGIALVGYTYVLEQAGIRFLKLAGTSAGAINTAFMVIPGKKSEPKSEYLMQALSDLELFKLVDGHAVARAVIKAFVKQRDFMSRVKKWLAIIFGVLALLMLSGFWGMGLQHKFSNLALITCAIFIVTGIYTLALALTAAYISSLLKRLKDSGFGINPGDFFYDWVKKHMIDQGVRTVTDLENKANENITDLRLNLRPNRNEKMSGNRDDLTDKHETTDDLRGEVVFITSELVTQNKFELPRMSTLFRTPDMLHTLEPAGFVRASMSIPIFFESYYIRDIPHGVQDPKGEVKNAWLETFNCDVPPKTLRFVDGGILSNFPINLFFNEMVKIPRLPTFGIDLDDTSPQNREEDAESWTLGGYIGRMFNTIRYYYDKDFLLKNKVARTGIGKVSVPDFNWLNFFLTSEEKLNMFARGAAAAEDFLRNFDWNAYKGDRKEYMSQIKNK